MSRNVSIRGVVKKYGDFVAVDHVDLEIRPGEFFTLLGPSGCGKTTLLRAIAGFNHVDEGEIYFGDQLMNNIEAHKRDIGMVFQNYAIFPHMTVKENVAYGLKAKKIPKKEIEKKVMSALEQVQIAALAGRKPNELSGGQQQRVALARAFVIEPGVLLMDEPLSNLDAKLRVQMRSVIKRLQRELGITTIYVTHDQEEALAISDRIAVMDRGTVMQVGTPEEIYKKPRNMFVAGFIGTSNFIETACAQEKENTAVITLDGNPVEFRTLRACPEKVTLSLRPEQIFFTDRGMNGQITFSTFLGDFVEYDVKLWNGQTIQVNEYTKDADHVKSDGLAVKVWFEPRKAYLYDSATKEVLSC